MAFPSIPLNSEARFAQQSEADTTAARVSQNLDSITTPSGDLIIALWVGYETSAASGSAWSGYTGGLVEFIDQASASNMCIGGAYRWSTGSLGGQFQATQAATITGHCAILVMSITGAHASTPPEASDIAVGTSSAANPSALAPSWGAEDTLWINVVGSGETSTSGTYTGTIASATNYGNDYIVSPSADAVGAVQMLVGFRQLNTASEDVGTASVDLSNARNCSLVIAVRPAGAAAPAVLSQGFIDFNDPGVL